MSNDAPSGVARGAGGASAPGRRPEGGAKILPKNFLKFISGKIFKILKKNKNKNVVIFVFGYILDFSAPPPAHQLTKLVTIFLYIYFLQDIAIAPPPSLCHQNS